MKDLSKLTFRDLFKIPPTDTSLVPVQSQIMLKEGEVAYMNYPAVRYITKNRVVGRTASTGGVGVRLGRVSVHSGGIAGQSIWADVIGTFHGTFTLTNKRIIFVASQNGFEHSLGSISAISLGDDGLVMIATPQYTYTMHIIKKITSSQLKKLQAGKKEKLPVIVDASNILVDMIDKMKGVDNNV